MWEMGVDEEANKGKVEAKAGKGRKDEGEEMEEGGKEEMRMRTAEREVEAVERTESYYQRGR